MPNAHFAFYYKNIYIVERKINDFLVEFFYKFCKFSRKFFQCFYLYYPWRSSNNSHILNINKKINVITIENKFTPLFE